MKKNSLKIFLCLFMFLILPNVINAEKDIPTFSTSYIDTYYGNYTCKYQLNLSDEASTFFGSFQFNVTFSKLGGATDVSVSLLGNQNIDSNKISVLSKNSIGKNIYYDVVQHNYYCPPLMAYLTVTQNNNDKLGSQVLFEVKDFNKQIYDGKKTGNSDRYYKLIETNITSYSCGTKTTLNDCDKDQHCSWVNTGSRKYACRENKYSTTIEENKIRTESCSGYKGSKFENKLEYKFALDKTLSVNAEGSGSTIIADKVEDKEGQLWALWTEGKCCPSDKLGINWKDNGKTMVLSCDGSESIFDYENDNGESGTSTNPGENVYGCEVIPDEIREWIKDSLNLVKYIALVLVIVLGVLDFVKAAASGEADQMKKSGNSFLKRIIAVVILFLLPLIVELILNLIEIFGADSTCLPQ